MLCTDVSNDTAAINAGKDEKPAEGGLSRQERKLAERLLLELYCQYDASLAFREVVNPEVRIFPPFVAFYNYNPRVIIFYVVFLLHSTDGALLRKNKKTYVFGYDSAKTAKVVCQSVYFFEGYNQGHVFNIS